MATMRSTPARDPPAGSPPLLPSDDELVAAATRFRDAPRPMDFLSGQPLDGGTWTGFAYTTVAEPIAWVKRARSIGETHMQIFAYEQLLAIPPHTRQNIRVPKVYRVIEHDDDVYIVMEYVHGHTLQNLLKEGGVDEELVNQLIAQVANAMSLFANFQVPSNAKPGPGEGCLIQHVLFKDQEAPIEYDSVMTVKQATPTIDFSQERMCFCYSDIEDHNFIFTDATQGYLYVIDFEHAAFLPVSFMSYALFCSSSWLPQDVGNRTKLSGAISSDSKNLRAMAWLQHIFTRCRPHIGLPF
ncbi:hypothetical protein QBC46DRAFT_426480 [Diplogelasinospora grovesii]|uniref:Protein kinase domain-containing protein n=1 Tax=Diplogelasinospora grovesii TaxID=303347 RepID=A0AAN6NE61_9PEZI|nr:hypothetical protein QBC46DRAFT_426480 [Diplogelasinospora grovesii]